MRCHLLGRNGYCAQISVSGRILKGGGALLTLQQELYAAKPALDLTDARNDTHRVQDVRCWLLGVVALRNGEYETVALEGRFDSTKS